MNTKRNKRWNGDVAKLPVDYLNNVIEKMQSYGTNVQFSTNGTISGPHFQVINDAGKKIAFSGNCLLVQLDENEFTDETSAKIYSLEQVKSFLIKTPFSAIKSSTSRTKRVPGTSAPRGAAAVAKIKDQIALQKYEYYKENRASLPPDIRDHSKVITELMEKGVPAEEAFAEAIKLCFVHLD